MPQRGDQMDCIGQLKNVTKNWMTGKFELTFEIETDVAGALDSIKDKLLTITAKQFRKKRSLDANAYYWQLLTKLAEASHISKNRAHNLLLARYGQLEMLDGRLVYVILPDTPDGEERAMEADTFHIKPTSQVKTGHDGQVFRTYIMIRGSSTYDTEEMSKLINGLVDECKALGIETMTPDQMAEMMAIYERNWRKNHEEAV